MNNQPYYQYAFARPGCLVRGIGPGVDPRFEVELVCDGPIAAVASGVGLDQFDVEKLQGRTIEDIGWLKQVALRHDEIVSQAASSSPLLPLRLGTIFQSRTSLLAAMARGQATVADFLRKLGDRQEWAVKLYLEGRPIEEAAASAAPPFPHHAPAAGVGTVYLKRKATQLRRRRESQAEVQQEIQGVEHQLKSRADHHCRVRPLPAGLSGRREKMVYHAAFLLAGSEVEVWLAVVERIREAVRRKGLLLEVTGPWPPYHFCPTPTW